MMMMGLHFMGEVPFKRVLLHGMLVDETGDKMSKVKGNTLDPLDIIHGAEFDAVVRKLLPDAPPEEALAKFKKAYPSVAQMGKGFAAHGTDALRMTLASYSPQAKRIALSPARIGGYRKLHRDLHYHAFRPRLHCRRQAHRTATRGDAAVNRWILSRLSRRLRRGVRVSSDRLRALYRFFGTSSATGFSATKRLQRRNRRRKTETRGVLAHVLKRRSAPLPPVRRSSPGLWRAAARAAFAPFRSPSRRSAETGGDGAWARHGILMAAIGALAPCGRHDDALERRVPLQAPRRGERVRSLIESGQGRRVPGRHGRRCASPLGAERRRDDHHHRR
jgi:valyl-tRNA synthetase